MATDAKKTKAKKPKLTKEQKAQARKEMVAYCKWRIGLVFTSKDALPKKIEAAVAAEDTKRLNVMLNSSGLANTASNELKKNLAVMVWEEVVAQKKTDLYSFLMEHKSDPGIKEQKKSSWLKDRDVRPGQYILAYAAQQRKKDLLKASIEAGVEPNFNWEISSSWTEPDLRGYPIQHATRAHDLEMMEILYDAGVKPGSGSVVTMLVKDLANKQVNEDSYACLDLALSKGGTNLNWGDGELLRIAARGHDDKTFQKLLNAGADIELSLRFAQQEADVLEFMHCHVEKSRTGWHVVNEDTVMKVSYSPTTDTRMREVFNFESETLTVQINDSLATRTPFNELAPKQLAKATQKQQALQQDNAKQTPAKRTQAAAHKK